jgi:hypothetical protein
MLRLINVSPPSPRKENHKKQTNKQTTTSKQLQQTKEKHTNTGTKMYCILNDMHK